MADSAELAFVKTHLNNIGSLPVQYADDYQQPPHNSLKKIPIVPIELPAPPAPRANIDAGSSETIILSFKVSKPARTFSFPVSPADTISSIKSQLSAQPGAPPAETQRLLLRGKALADGKLLKEYPVKSGDTVNLMLKSGFEWDWNTAASASLPASESETKTGASKDEDGDVQMKLDPETGSTRMRRHGRIPSVVLSPSPSTALLPLTENPPQIPLTLDTSNIPTGNEVSLLDTYHRKISSPDFWTRLHSFLKSEFERTEDADIAFEAFLVGSKGDLSPSDIAKIRDTVGIVGMNGS